MSQEEAELKVEAEEQEELEATAVEQEETMDLGSIITGAIAIIILSLWFKSKTAKKQEPQQQEIVEKIVELKKERDVEVTREEDGSISKILVVEGDKYKVLEVYKDNYGRIRKLSWWGSK